MNTASSTPHEVTLQGCAVRVSGPGKASGKKRGRVTTGGSKKSLRRLSLLLGSVDWASYKRSVLFLTLTLPPSVHSAESLGPALDRLRKWLLCKFPEAAAVVRIEQGGASSRLHAHVLVFGAAFIPAATLRALWKRCLRCPEAPRVGVELVRNGNAMAAYLCKYIAKLTTHDDGKADAEGDPAAGGEGPAAAVSLSTSHIWQGRVWQVWGRERIRYAPGVTFVISGEGLNRLKRILRRLWGGFKSGCIFVQPSTCAKLEKYLMQWADPFPLDGSRCSLY